MELLIQLLLAALLILITYQDYKFRAVSWILFPLLFIAFFFYNFISQPLSQIADNSLLNFSFILFLFAMVTIYFSLKHGRIVNLSKGFIGWGDILFILCLGILFSPLNFVLFYLVSLVLIIAGTLISKLTLKTDSDKIPLAGLQALLLLLLLLANLAVPFIQFSTDEWIVNALM